ncbi:unnamed protein product [Soboliphyme baturini]|uniref:SH3 domain-containing protein n=1 Tax=Soboliphyme baturini TaxID=241478 RepID=A0A183IMK1_9BILA|nr:unnamed protein product [Soboliphyme baturini]
MPVRKLRRRANDPLPFSERKMKKSNPVISYALDACKIADDLKKICSNSRFSKADHSSAVDLHMSGDSETSEKQTAFGSDEKNVTESDTRMTTNLVSVDGGKLVYSSKCYTRGQLVTLETVNDDPKPVFIQSISMKEVCFRSAKEKKKMLVPIEELQNGNYVLRPSQN